MNEPEGRKLSTVTKVALLPLLVVLAGGLVTALLFWQERKSALADFRLHFKERAEARADTVVQKMAEYLFFVKTVGRLAQASESGRREAVFPKCPPVLYATTMTSEAEDGYLRSPIPCVSTSRERQEYP